MPIDARYSLMLVLAAVMFGGVGLLMRVARLLRRPRAAAPSPARGDPGYGVKYAFTWGMLPWNKESGRAHPWIFWAGVIFHAGIVLSGALLVERLAIGEPLRGITWYLALLPLAGVCVGAANLLRRLWEPEVLNVSEASDFLTVLLVTALMAGAWLYGWGAVAPLWFDLTVVALMLHLPFSKVRHMVTFFFARYYHGEQLGALGIYAPGQTSAGADAAELEALRVEQDPDAVPAPPAAVPPLTAEQRQQLVTQLDQEATRQTEAMIDTCVHCGLCAEACHYHLAMGEARMIPVAKAAKVAQAHRGGRALTEQQAAELHQASYEHCSLCGRCGLTCPMGINTGEVMSWSRAAFSNVGAAPVGLDTPAARAVEQGNYLGLPVDDVVENLEWIGEELEDELEQQGLQVPVDLQGAEVLYIPHPLELRDFPMVVMAAAKIFHQAGESYTFSSEHFDTVNYAYYSGNKEQVAAIIERLERAATKLGVKRVVLSPCGHGYRVLRWEAEKVLGRALPFEVLSLAELLDQYLEQGKLTLKPGTLSGAVTYHDPCNMARRGGVIEQPRRVLRALTSQYVEMLPGGASNYCCGGGGGLAATGDYGKTRLQAGGVKAKQIQQTGAKIVITNCFNCNTQIKELERKHKLGIKVTSITEAVADAL